MDISEFLTTERVIVDAQSFNSKKRIIEFIALRFSETIEQISKENVFDKLIAREKMGSTGMASGIAIPHARIEGINQPYALFMRLQNQLKFNAHDNKPVDLIFALIVPEDASKLHLQLMKNMEQIFKNKDITTHLRQTNDIASIQRTFQSVLWV